MLEKISRRFAGAALGIVFSLGLGSLALPSTAQAQIGELYGLSPYWDWKTIETEHFRVTFPKELAESAQKSATYFEEAHRFLSPKLLWTPRNKTQILLIDNADAANGLTTPIGRFGILLYLTPPDNWFSTQYYDDWLRMLVIHEYAHFLNMDATTDFWSVLRYAFGDVLLPNALWPSWMLEGLAVYMETRYTQAGRGRSTYYEMILRAAVAENVLDNPSFITLDKVNGPNPYYPFGETAYLFGYQLMNQVARQKPSPTLLKAEDRYLSADERTVLVKGSPSHPSENSLSEMSLRSSGRIPFFINTNLENISGKDWYTQWDDWVADTRKRAGADLAKIQTQPLTPVQRLTQDGQQTLGSAFSRDGRWFAYSKDSSDQLNSLYLQDRTTGENHRLDQKVLGSTVAFTPDSKNIIFSTLNRKGLYYLWSDLKAHRIEENSSYSLTDGLRVRDPDISRDGQWITFAINRSETTGVGIARLTDKGGRLRLSNVKIAFMPSRYDAIHTPKFSSDGKRIYFSWHRNGKPSEDIAVIDLGGTPAQPRVLVSNGKMNRFPAIRSSASGDELFFASDLTGVQNVYRYQEGMAPVLVTNTTTGFAFPTFDAQGNLFANVFSTRGWDIAKIEAHEKISVEQATIAPPPAPSGDQDSAPPSGESKKYEVEDYSIFPSIWPRQWFPLLFWNKNGFYAGGQILGFDAVDRHLYLAGAAYDSFTKETDVLALYRNRSFGPDLSVAFETRSANVANSGSTLTSYERKFRFTSDLRLPIRWTFSTLTPVLAFQTERTFLHVPGANPSNDDIVSKSTYVPFTDARLLFSDAQSTRLAISAEKGRFVEVGTRAYFGIGDTVIKSLLRDTEYLRTDFLIEHSVLVPSVAYSWVNHTTSGYLDANVVVEGRQSGRLLNTLPGPSLDNLAVRGYPLQTFSSRQAGIGSLDYRFPLIRIFRGWGTNPVFLENVHAFVFGEAVYFPSGRRIKTLPAAGGGVQLDSTLLNNIPLTMSTEYHKGFREDFGGDGELFFQLKVNSPISF